MKRRKPPQNKGKYKSAESHGCKRKRRFKDRQQAKGARANIPTPMRIYECNYCKGFHLTSKV